MISSPFLRCLQTAAQVSRELGLPGVRTCNGLCELVSSGCHMKGRPEVPCLEEAEGIAITGIDSAPLPEFPEEVDVALARSAWQSSHYSATDGCFLPPMCMQVCGHIQSPCRCALAKQPGASVSRVCCGRGHAGGREEEAV